MNPLVKLQEFGQSPWYDYIRRGLITSGELRTLIDQDGLMGITSNPSIFEKAIGGSTDYNESLREVSSGITGVNEIYEALVIRDIQDAADLMDSVFKRTQGRDGYVSLEVSPHLAHDATGTIQEALRLHQAIGKENVMIKVPATPEGIPAIETLTSKGLNINVTLLFSIDVYEQVAWAYISGLEKLEANGGNPSKVGSVASFFVSRIDTAIDGLLEKKLKESVNPEEENKIQRLMGKTAIANAKLAYLRYQEIFSDPRFEILKKKGTRVQRLLWASTGTKNPRYPDTYYVDSLIGADTVNTLPVATFNAFRDHGNVQETLTEGLENAKETMRLLSEMGIDLSRVTSTLLEEGVSLFADAFDRIMSVIQQKRRALLGPKLDQISYSLGRFQENVRSRLGAIRRNGFTRRLWMKDPNLWQKDKGKHDSILNGLGWLNLPELEVHHLARIKDIVGSIQADGFEDVVLLGMGGSSLCPEVCRLTYGVVPGYPELHVLDSTVPAQIRSLESRIDLTTSLFIVSSKSGTTSETLALYHYFFDKFRRIRGSHAGDHFIAITDPGSFLENLAREKKFREVLPGMSDVGGRYSALSNFGIVPAAIMGVSVAHLLYRSERMRHSCDLSVPPEDNPGISLGVVLAELAQRGLDKLTLITSPSIRSLGSWLEQLIAESTGKEGKGVIPIDEEPLGSIEAYGNDRFFVYIRSLDNIDTHQENIVSAFETAGRPVVRINLSDRINLGEEFFLWEIATAVAGSLLGVNAFDQPNVQESKDQTKSLLDIYKKKGCLPEGDPFAEDDKGFQVFGSPERGKTQKGSKNAQAAIAAHLARIKDGDYFAINAYLEKTKNVHKVLQDLRLRVRDKKKVATTLGYGPRFLHSTGQLHKGGPNSGVFIQITAEDGEDLPIPGEPYTFSVLKAAQALGDFQSLSKRNRRAIRIHLGADVEGGLRRLEEAVERGL